jgi:hypothetical protein
MMNKQLMAYTQIMGRVFRDQTKPPAFILDHDGKIARNFEVKVTKLYGDMIFSFITIDAGRLIFKHTKRPVYNYDTQRWDTTFGGIAVSAGVLASGVPFDPTVLHPSGFWKHAPEWANYYAVDCDGDAYWYKEQPSLLKGHWDTECGDVQCVKFGREDCEPQLYSRTMGRVK